MLRYRYAEDVAPPAPFVHAAISDPAGSATTESLPAQLDCGADRTVVPISVVQQLQLKTLRELAVAGFDGNLPVVNTFVIKIAIHELEPITIEAIAADEPFVLLGRDVLNSLGIVLDGPNRILEIG